MTQGKTFSDLAQEKFGDAISQYARGNPELELHAINACYPAVAALELDEGYAALMVTARMDNILATIIEHGCCRQGNPRKLLIEYPAPLSAFSAKIDMAYLAGFITLKLKTAINHCRHLRNAYAHNDTPDAGQADEKYVNHKNALLGMDTKFTDFCIDELNGEGNEYNRDTHGVMAIMVKICDNLSSVAMIARMSSGTHPPEVVSGFYGFEVP